MPEDDIAEPTSDTGNTNKGGDDDDLTPPVGQGTTAGISGKDFGRPDALQWRPDTRPLAVTSGASCALRATGSHSLRSLASGRQNSSNSSQN